VRHGCGIAAIREHEVVLEDGRAFAASRVVLATGVRPNIQLAQRRLACRRGIVVDRQLATALPGVSASANAAKLTVRPGDWWRPVCARLRCWPGGYAAPEADFHWQDSGTRLKVTGIELFSAGERRPATRMRSGPAGTRWPATTAACWSATASCRRFAAGRLRKCRAAHRAAGDPRSQTGFLILLQRSRALQDKTMTKPVLVLVGHGMVGHHFLEQCVSRNLHQQFRIVVFGEERYAAYDRVHLSEYFAGVARNRCRWWTAISSPGTESNCGCLRRLRPLTAKRGGTRYQRHETHWDKLVLATGSYPFVPVPGHDLEGCFVYRTLDDLDRIAACASSAKRGVVIGGGLLGLEAANALRQLGLETHVVEFAPNLMAVQLDNRAPRCCGRKSMILASVCIPARRLRVLRAVMMAWC
jgi:nitrite reductase (NADH) large subunit